MHWKRKWQPRDGGTWWAAVYGVAQSQTPLRRLSSSSSSSRGTHIGLTTRRWSVVVGAPGAADVYPDKAQKPALCVRILWSLRMTCPLLSLSDMASLEPRGVAWALLQPHTHLAPDDRNRGRCLIQTQPSESHPGNLGLEMAAVDNIQVADPLLCTHENLRAAMFAK